MDSTKQEHEGVMKWEFADNKLPSFEPQNNLDWIPYGKDDKYPNKIIEFYSKSAKHAAIINGKLTYILGEGIKANSLSGKKFAASVNQYGETLNDILNKSVLDTLIFGGFYLNILKNKGNGVQIYHLPFKYVRIAKNEKYYLISKDWLKAKYHKEGYEPYSLPIFDGTGKQASSIYSFKEYRPDNGCYALPDYTSILNWIEIDIEVSKFHLSGIKNGMFPTKLIQFFNGEPTEEAKKKLKDRLEVTYSGSENAGKPFISFNQAGTTPISVDDLSNTNLDKMFEIMNKTVQEEIFIGHSAPPSVFGIETPGKLGSGNEVKERYEQFKKTYVTKKQQDIEKVVALFSKLYGVKEELKIVPVEPLGFTLDNQSLIQVAPREWVLDQLGIDRTKYPITNTQQDTNTSNNQTTATNQKMSATYSENDICDMFDTVGESRSNYTIISNERADFSKDDDCRTFELNVFQKFAYDPTQTETDILNLISKDKRITVDTLAETLGVSKYVVSYRIGILIKKGLLQQSEEKIGEDKVIVREVVKPVSEITDKVPNTLDVFIKYSYEKGDYADGSELLATSRPFCVKLIKDDKLYSRSEIEQISQRLGYSVWDRRGGFWNNNGEIEYYCRHEWKSNIVVKKN